MSSDREETDATKSYTEHTDAVQEDSSVGAKVGQGFSGGMKVIHGIGETIRGLAIDLADLGKGSGKTIAEDGKVETQEGVRQVGNSLHR